MKKLFLTSFLCLLLSPGGNAQGSYKHDIQLSTGLWASEYAAIEGYINLFTLLLLRETVTPFQRSNGAYATYRYRISRRVSVGLSTGATLLNTDEAVFGYSRSPGKYRYVSALFAVEGQFHYIDRPKWSLYSVAGGGLGGTFERNSDNSTGPAEETRYPLLTMQVTPVGVRFGKVAGVFAELGYGYKGILNTGVSVRF